MQGFPKKGRPGTPHPFHGTEKYLSVSEKTCELESCAELATEWIRHPLRSESRTELCERHAERARAVTADGLKCSPFNGRRERRQATRGALRRRNGRGERDSPTCVTKPTMDASNPTHPEGENVSGESVDWETVGKELLRGELERHSTSLRDSFQEISHSVERGDVDEAKLEELQWELQSVRDWLEIVKGEM